LLNQSCEDHRLGRVLILDHSRQKCTPFGQEGFGRVEMGFFGRVRRGKSFRISGTK